MKEIEDEATSGGNPKWYEEYPKQEEPSKHSKSETEVSNLKDEAKRYFDAETSAYQLKESKSRDSEAAWLKTALTQGTTSDKVAAAVILIQDNPKCNLTRLTMLINQVRTIKHNQCIMVIKSLRDLFLSDLLHPEFKLLKFEEQNLHEIDQNNTKEAIVKTNASRRKLMVHWYFEDQLHEQYERFIMSLAAIASDTVDANREAAISVMTDLLIGNSEQEHKLLELIINKIGDPSNKVGSKVIFCLNKLLHEHPNMKLVVLREVEKLLFRKNVMQRAQYYAICLLTQFILSKDDEQIASTLIEVYFAFFKACLKKGEPDSRMMAAILTGVNRAYPFAKMDSNILHNHIDSVYKVVHIGSFNVSLNALNLLYQVTGKDEAQANRFYSTFYRKLLDPQIGVVNKRALFLNLLYRVLQKDNKIPRLYALIRRSLQIALYFPANMTCAILYIISKIIHSHKELRTLLLKSQTYIKAKHEDVEIEDTSFKDINTFDKPNTSSEDSILLTNITMGLGMNEETKPDLKVENDTKIELSKQKDYDPFYRNPLYAGVTEGLNTELITLSKHYHPSVSLFASTIIEGKFIDYTGDPLEDLSLMRFLDRYVFKNPKKLEDRKVQKKNDPLAQRAGYTPRGIRSIPVDSVMYLNEKEERIPVDELFLYRYLKKRKEFKREFKKEDDDDIESINSEEFDDMLGRLTDGKDFEDLDIAADIQTRKKKKKEDTEEDGDANKVYNGDEDEDFEDNCFKGGTSGDFDDKNDSDLDLNDSEDTDNELHDLSDMDLDEDYDASDIDFDDDVQSSITNKQTKKNYGQTKQNKKGTDSNIFMSAEKFAEMLEEHSKQRGKYGGTDMLNTADGASTKQIDWEIKRHQKLKSSFNKTKRKSSTTFKKNIKKIKH
ncbi:nucleolar complex protein 1 [Nomia melanderi]|uniref:nucleolar complex protein 1 n=1 Tax=Nomia melanderi TaxID=2448451 RepID=UPI001304278C|nr:CCAAT/enhancer-binding protein zeta-like isoform X1 [Nomia melanderi]XP_031841758.1 CCAAT/enhancer-binding protein zeta-like isoform X1 [Nomia melanderi]